MESVIGDEAPCISMHIDRENTNSRVYLDMGLSSSHLCFPFLSWENGYNHTTTVVSALGNGSWENVMCFTSPKRDADRQLAWFSQHFPIERTWYSHSHRLVCSPSNIGCFLYVPASNIVKPWLLRYGKLILSGTTVKSGEAYCVVRLTGAAQPRIFLQPYSSVFQIFLTVWFQVFLK